MKIRAFFVVTIAVVVLSLTFSLNALAAKKLYVTNAGNNTVSVIDTASYKVINTIRVGVWPAGISIDSAAQKAYVVNSSPAKSSVSVVDLKSNSVVSTVKVGVGPMGVALDSASGIGYVVNSENMVEGKNMSHTISIVDLKTNKVSGEIDVGTGPFDIKIAGDKIFTSNSGEWQLAAISK
jgi:YVTN family beta-propeller protein